MVSDASERPPALPLPITSSDVRVREVRVAEIARLVHQGAYRVEAALVADSVLRFHRREV
jgi:anti-sigma28 factor (negative regulator of flagellin synthesis)